MQTSIMFHQKAELLSSDLKQSAVHMQDGVNQSNVTHTLENPEMGSRVLRKRSMKTKIKPDTGSGGGG